MTNRLTIPLLCAASVLAFAKGYTPHKATLAETPVRSHSKSELETKLSVKAGDVVELNLSVRNNTKKMVELRFPSGKTHEFIVQNAGGVEVWRSGKSRTFTQMVQAKLVKAKDVAVYSEELDASNLHGHYTAIAKLESENHPIEERVEFDLK
jgi:hypothetical protein